MYIAICKHAHTNISNLPIVLLLIHESLCDYCAGPQLDNVDTIIPMGKSSKLKYT